MDEYTKRILLGEPLEDTTPLQWLSYCQACYSAWKNAGREDIAEKCVKDIRVLKNFLKV